MLQHLALESERWNAPSLDFSATTYHLAHFYSNFSELMVRGVLKRTRSPTSISLSLTFGSLHVLVSS
jgi:hypothetical protein